MNNIDSIGEQVGYQVGIYGVYLDSTSYLIMGKSQNSPTERNQRYLYRTTIQVNKRM